ncbi:MAG: hypothetical protein WC299_10060 [Kiritimatiellia bacterium]
MKSTLIIRNAGAALAAVLIMTSTTAVAQEGPVASRNSAGYIRLTVARRALYQVHYPLLGVEGRQITVNEVMAGLPNGSALTFWDPAAQAYATGQANEVKLMGAWTPGTNNLCGRAFWLQVGNSVQANFDIYLIGEAPDAWTTPTATVTLAPCGVNSLSLVGYVYPLATRWTATSISSNVSENSSIMIFDPATKQYQTAVKRSGTWNADPLLQPGQSFWLNSRNVETWTEVKPYVYP